MATWENKLVFLQEGLLLLNQVQRKWVYLHPIFARGALPMQQARFRSVDDEFRRVMGLVEYSKKVVDFAGRGRAVRIRKMCGGMYFVDM